MVFRVQFDGSNDVGVFAKLTNKYCITAISSNCDDVNYYGGGGSAVDTSSKAFHCIIENELASYSDNNKIPVIRTTIGGCRIVGRLTVANSYGLLVPNTITEQELHHLRHSLPDSVMLKQMDERLSALGNVISCNDQFALIHPELDHESKEIISDILKVEVLPQSIGKQSLVGAYCSITNCGGLLHSRVTMEQKDELSSMLQLPLSIGTVNRGSDLIGSGLLVNDWIGFCGSDTTAAEIGEIENIFQLYNFETNQQKLNINSNIRITHDTMRMSLFDQT